MCVQNLFDSPEAREALRALVMPEHVEFDAHLVEVPSPRTEQEALVQESGSTTKV